MRNLSFADFVAYGAHGVAGAAASTSPALPGPVYFNESVIPDTSLSQTTIDGGIVWTEVPSGNYTVTASHPTTRFASFRASCRDGRIVNANPPWGLFELKPGEKPPSEVGGSGAAAAGWPYKQIRAPEARSGARIRIHPHPSGHIRRCRTTPIRA